MGPVSSGSPLPLFHSTAPMTVSFSVQGFGFGDHTMQLGGGEGDRSSRINKPALTWG